MSRDGVFCRLPWVYLNISLKPGGVNHYPGLLVVHNVRRLRLLEG